MRYAALSLSILLSAGCAARRGFDRGALHSQLGDRPEVTDEAIQRALDLKAQLPRPFRLAVYLQNPKRVGRWDPWNTRDIRWTSDDKDKILGIADELKGVVSEVVHISDSLIEGSPSDIGKKEIRLAAARSGADAVLIVRAVSSVDRYNNRLGPAYLLVVTPLFVPGTVADALVVASASMWDVRNEFLYLSVDGEGTASQTAPAAFVNEDKLLVKAKISAVEEMRKELLSRLLKLDSK